MQTIGKEIIVKTIGQIMDATSFAHKTNPFKQACAPKGRTGRKKSEGQQCGCTSKG